MNAIPSSPTDRLGSPASATAATGSQIAAARAENSHTNVAPPAAVFASTFQAAWARAARTTRARTAVDTEELLSDGPRSGLPRGRAPRPTARRRAGGRYCPSGMQTTSALDILVVDDDEPLRDMLTRSFEREGHRVTAVPDGQAALARAAEQDFDVVLLDVALGAGPAGHDVARALRARRAVVPIIMLTALDSEADVVQGLEAGADDYVTKPFGLAELRSRIRAVL